jgi:hypothetical protein
MWPKPEQPHAAVARVQRHALVLEKAFQRALLPAGPLTPQHAQRLRHFGPAGGIRDEADAIFPPFLDHVAVEAHDDVEVLAKRPGRIAADLHHHIAAEQPEGARYDQQGVDPAPGKPPHQEGSQIFHDLDARQEAIGKPDLLHLPALGAEAVGDAQSAADRDHALRIVEEGLDGADQRVGLQDRCRRRRCRNGWRATG